MEKDNSFAVHHYNIQRLCIKLYKVFSGQSQTIFSDLLERKNINYNLRSQPDFVIPQVKTVYKKSNSFRYFGPIIWGLIPTEIKNRDTLVEHARILYLTSDLKKQINFKFLKFFQERKNLFRLLRSQSK